MFSPHHAWRRRLVLGIGAFFLVPLLTPARAADDDEGGETVYDRVMKSVVWIIAETEKKGQFATGSGSLIDTKQRLVLTNAHVVGNNKSVTVFFPIVKKGQVKVEREYYFEKYAQNLGIRGAVQHPDVRRDLAIIRLDRGVPLPPGTRALSLAAKSARPGQRVHSVGNSGQSGALWIYTSGTVRSIYHKTWESRSESGGPGTKHEARVLETQSPINPGDSGGPVVNDKSELIAVTQGYKASAQLVSIFVDVSEVRKYLEGHKDFKVLVAKKQKAGTKAGQDEVRPAKSTPAAGAAEKAARAKLEFARAYERDGLVDKAREYYRQVLDKYPNTRAADEARTSLKNLK